MAQQSPLQLLPVELHEEILRRLAARDLLAAVRTCRAVYESARSVLLWEKYSVVTIQASSVPCRNSGFAGVYFASLWRAVEFAFFYPWVRRHVRTLRFVVAKHDEATTETPDDLLKLFCEFDEEVAQSAAVNGTIGLIATETDPQSSRANEKLAISAAKALLFFPRVTDVHIRGSWLARGAHYATKQLLTELWRTPTIRRVTVQRVPQGGIFNVLEDMHAWSRSRQGRSRAQGASVANLQPEKDIRIANCAGGDVFRVLNGMNPRPDGAYVTRCTLHNVDLCADGPWYFCKVMTRLRALRVHYGRRMWHGYHISTWVWALASTNTISRAERMQELELSMSEDLYAVVKTQLPLFENEGLKKLSALKRVCLHGAFLLGLDGGLVPLCEFLPDGIQDVNFYRSELVDNQAGRARLLKSSEGMSAQFQFGLRSPELHDA